MKSTEEFKAQANAWLGTRPEMEEKLRHPVELGIDGGSAVVAARGGIWPPGLGCQAGRTATVLAEAALDRLRATTRPAEQSRDVAMDLLAADALITYACEAAAAGGASVLEAFVHQYGICRIEEMLRQEQDIS